jgi:hypothetical protein
VPPLTSRAQMMRAILLARATVTGISACEPTSAQATSPRAPRAGWPVEPLHSPQPRMSAAVDPASYGCKPGRKLSPRLKSTARFSFMPFAEFASEFVGIAFEMR